MSNLLSRAKEIAADRIRTSGYVLLGDFLSGMPYGVEETKLTVQELVDSGELEEIERKGPKEADRAFIHPQRT